MIIYPWLPRLADFSLRWHRSRMATGLFRDGEWVQVNYRSRALIPVRRDYYEAAGSRPAFDDLPTKAEYESKRP